MNTMIANPHRTVTINKPLGDIMLRLAYIEAWTNKNTGIEIADAHIDCNLNCYTFHSKSNISGIADFGNVGNVCVEPISDNMCKLSIEIGKNYGHITDQFEAQDCTTQITYFLTVLSALIDMTEEQLKNFPKKTSKSSSLKVNWGWIIVLLGIIMLGSL